MGFVEVLPELLAGVAGFAVVNGAVFYSARNYVASQRNTLKLRTPHLDNKSFPEKFQDQLKIFKNLILTHQEQGSKKTASKMTQVVRSIDGLFERLAKKGTNEQLIMASVKYAYILEKLSFALGEDTYLDVVQNPGLWNDAEKKMKDSEQALNEVHKQIVENIKQLNDRNELDFRVALDALLSVSEKEYAFEEVFNTEKIEEVAK